MGMSLRFHTRLFLNLFELPPVVCKLNRNAGEEDILKKLKDIDGSISLSIEGAGSGDTQGGSKAVEKLLLSLSHQDCFHVLSTLLEDIVGTCVKATSVPPHDCLSLSLTCIHV